jgi:hypothetical protein
LIEDGTVKAGPAAFDRVAWSSGTGRFEKLFDEGEYGGFVIEPGCSDADG